MYKTVVYRDMYKDIDMKFYGNNRQMEYDIIVKPGANPSRVQLVYKGIEGLRVVENGDLEISLKEGKLIQKKPYVYQDIGGKRVEREGKFRIQKNAVIARSKATKQSPAHEDEIASPGHALRSSTEARNDKQHATLNSKPETRNSKHATRNSQLIYGFTVASYDKRYPLVIDPVIAYSTYLGGSGADEGSNIAVDSAGNAYVTGQTYSPDFPTANAIDGSYNGGHNDAFVTKIAASGTSLSYSTYLGGSGYDLGNGIAVDSTGNAYVTGATTSSDFPTANAFDGSFNGYYGYNVDAFVTKIDASGASLSYSTYLGGSGDDEGSNIAVDSAGNAYVAGYTMSSDFPTANAFDGSFNGYYVDAFVTKIDNSSATAVALLSFTASANNDGNITLHWETATEVDNAGFNLYRSRLRDGEYKKINNALIPAQGDATAGANYSYEDTPPSKGTYFYKLEDVDTNGVSTMHGPEKVRVRK